MTIDGRWLRVIAVWLMVVSPGFSQATNFWLSGTPLPTAPASMVLDRADLLSRTPGLQNNVSNRLLELKQEHGFSLYLVIQSGLESDSPLTTASALQDTWVPDGNGIVVVYETDSKRVGFGRPYLKDPVFSDKLASFEMVTVISEAVHRIDRSLADEQIVVQLTEYLCDGFRDRIVENAAPPPAGRSLRLGLFMTGIASALALGTLIVGWLVRRGNEAKSRRFWFTEIDRPERLGAPFGGGSVVSRKFRR